MHVYACVCIWLTCMQANNITITKITIIVMYIVLSKFEFYNILETF